MDTDKSKLVGFNETDFGSMIWADAPAPPKSSNEGGITSAESSAMHLNSDDPRLVIREYGGKV